MRQNLAGQRRGTRVTRRQLYTGLRAWLRHPAVLVLGLILGLAEFALVPLPLLALPGLLLFIACGWRRLDLALGLLPLTFPYWYVPKPVWGHIVFPLSEIALSACLAIALARQAWLLLRVASQHSGALASVARWAGCRMRRRGTLVWGRAGRWIVCGAALLLLGGIAGVLVARRPHDALRAFRWEIIEPLVYLVLVVLLVRGRMQARLLVWAMLGSALVVALLAYAQVLWLHVTFAPLAQYNRLLPMARHGLAARATGIIYGSGNSLGAWLERAIPLALALALAARGLSRRERALALACAAIYVPPLIWSASRGAEVGALAACALVVVVSAIRPWLAIIVGGLIALALGIWQRTALTAAVLFGHHGTGEARLLVWLAALHMIRDHPVLGIGPDQFLYYYSSRYTRHPYWITRVNGQPTSLALDTTLAHPHNLVLDLWLSVGVAGLMGFALVLGNFWLRCARLWRTSRAGPWPAALALGAAASVLAGVIHGMVDSAYFEPDLALALWWAVALLIVLERAAHHGVRPAARPMPAPWRARTTDAPRDDSYRR